MAIKDGLRTLMLAESTITALCPAQTLKGLSLSAVFVDKAEQGAKPPFIIISRIGSDPMLALDGTYGMKSTEIDIDCYEATPTKAEALATAVSTYLDDYTGAAGGSDTIDAVMLEDTNDFLVPEEDGKDNLRHVVTLSFTIQHH